MSIVMAELSFGKAKIELRERLSFTKREALEAVSALSRRGGVSGAAILSTCNRTELYLSCPDGTPPEPATALCEAAGADYCDFADLFITRRGESAVRHLMEVASGLKSQILGEDQILAQVKTAAALAREAKGADAALETLFRTAVSCGKAVKTKLRLNEKSPSSAHSAVEMLERFFGELPGRRALVIGNGEMGRLTAALLRDRGVFVTMTLRSCQRGETLLPFGCAAVPYEKRYEAMAGVDILVSATVSPHCTVTAEALRRVVVPPRVMIDLAVPRDIEPEAALSAPLYNIDSFERLHDAAATDMIKARAIIDEHMEKFNRWVSYRECLPAIEELKEAVLQRVMPHVEAKVEPEEMAEAAAKCAVELIAGHLQDCLSPERLRLCAEDIRRRTR